MPTINGRYYMNPQYGAALEKARAADEESIRVNGAAQSTWLDRFLGLVPTDEEQRQISQADNNSSDIFPEASEGVDTGEREARNVPEEAKPPDRPRTMRLSETACTTRRRV